MKELTLFPKHLGIWEGTYSRINADGTLRDQWKSRLTCSMDGRKYHQVNQYFWDDGFEECLDFGVCEFTDEGVLIFDNPRLYGEAYESGRSVILTWNYKDQPGSMLFEQIDLIGDKEDTRIRVWKWANDKTGEFNGVTMISERKVCDQSGIDPQFWIDLPNIKTNGKASRSDG